MTEAVLSAGLQEEWQGIEAQYMTNEVYRDTCRAAVLQRYGEAGMTHRDMGNAVGLEHPRITQLLRYHRFLVTAVTKELTERRFRAYWQQVSDPRMVRGRRNPADKEAYEQIVFQAIVAMLDAGKPPQKPVKLVKRQTPEQLRANVDWAKATKKEVKRIYETELQPTLKHLQGYLHADRATYTPSLLADAARSLDRGFKAFFALLAGLEDEAMITLTDEPVWHYTGSGARVPNHKASQSRTV